MADAEKAVWGKGHFSCSSCRLSRYIKRGPTAKRRLDYLLGHDSDPEKTEIPTPQPLKDSLGYRFIPIQFHKHRGVSLILKNGDGYKWPQPSFQVLDLMKSDILVRPKAS